MYPDIFFTAEYQELFQPTAFGGKPDDFYAYGIDYCFYRRPIEGTDYCDFVSPYGYSGPIAIHNDANWVRFLKALDEYCQDEGIIAEFARLHPYLENHKFLEPECVYYLHDTVYIDLTQAKEQIWKGFDKGCKGAVKKKVNLSYPTAFRPLYEQTMKRIGAEREYLFTDSFWEKLNDLGMVHSAPGAMAVFLCHKPYAHYFLSASEIGGNINLLIWNAIQYFKAYGYKILNLGGGLKAGDSLESFKRSFSPTTKPFYVYKKIHNQDVYDILCKEKGIDPKSEGYFPAYRRPR